MVKLNRDRVREVIAGVDWGFTNPGVLLTFALDGDGRMYLIHEVYRSRKLIDWWVERACSVHREYRFLAVLCDPSEPAYIEAFRQAGLPVQPAFNEIKSGIQAVQNRLAVAADGRPRLFLYRDALAERDEELVDAKKPASTIEEFESYVWPKGVDGKPAKEIPVDDSNHGLDALRYAVCYADGKGRHSYAPVEF